MTNRVAWFTLTSVVGRFFFMRDVTLSHAKLVRDTITDHIMAGGKVPKDGNPTSLLQTLLEGPASKVYFEWELK